LTAEPCDFAVSFGISTPLGVLSPTRRQVSYALLTRSPLYSRGCPLFRVRLACLIHAANVRSEPGSNSPLDIHTHINRYLHRNRRSYKRSSRRNNPRLVGSSRAPQHSVRYSFVKERARDLRELAVLGPNFQSTAGSRCLSTAIFSLRTGGPKSRPDAGLPCSRPVKTEVTAITGRKKERYTRLKPLSTPIPKNSWLDRAKIQ
jgi:hypothetical protein